MARSIARTINKDWDELVDTIPDELEASAKEHGALQRRRGIKPAADLLRVNLMYATILSLRNTALWAACAGVCNISRQAIEKRVLNSTAWLRHLLSVLLTTLVETPPAIGGLIGRLVLVDASVIARRGSPGTEWRVHLAWHPFRQQPAEIVLSDAKEGEGLDKVEIQPDDLVITDRGYAIWRNLKRVLEALAYFIFRLTWSNLPLLTPDGQAFDIIAWLESLPEDETCAEITVIAADDPQRRPLRLIAGRLPPEKAEEARQRVRRQARKKKREPNPNTLLAAGFCILLTNLLASHCSALVVLTLYRIRWQVEWCFRRWKSLCRLDQLPAFPAAIATPVLLAKLILILLMQQRLGTLPWSEWWAAEEPAPVVSSLVQAAYAYLCDIIRPAYVLIKLLEDPTPFLRHLRSSRRKRSLQLADAARQFAELFTQFSPALGLS